MAGENFLYYKLRNNTAELWQSDGAVTIYNYNTSSQCLYDLRSYQNELFFQTATLADANGYSYLINIDNISRYFRTDSTLHIVFKNDIEIALIGISEFQTIKDFQYLTNLLYNWKIEENILNRNKKYIGTEYSIDIVNGYFPSFASARQYINEGDILIFSEGEYTEGIELDIAGVDIYAPNENVIFHNASNGASIIFANFNRVFGKAKFIETGSPNVALIYFAGSTVAHDDNMYSFISATLIESSFNRSTTADKGNCFYKIKTFTTSDNSHSNFDCDTSGVYIDVDCFLMEHTGTNANMFPIQNSGVNYIILRGGKFISGSPISIENNGYAVMTINTINCYFDIPKAGAGVIYTTDIVHCYVNIFNTYVSNPANNTYILFVFGEQAEINFYSNGYSCKGVTGDALISRFQGDFVEELNISSVL